MEIKLGARASDLSRIQAYSVGEALNKVHPELKVEFCFKRSKGDLDTTTPLYEMPDKGMFTDDFRADLIDGKIDLVVHSWKDLPTDPLPETEIIAALPRADMRDLLLVKKDKLDRIKTDGKIIVFSSSPRRQYNFESFLKWSLPCEVNEVNFVSVRGNVPTRVRKLIEDKNVDALVVAKAAIDRLLVAKADEFGDIQRELRKHLDSCYWMIAPLSASPSAPAQGALAVEISKKNAKMRELLEAIRCDATAQAVEKEREILASYGGGCHQKIGASCKVTPFGEFLTIKGVTDQGEVLNTLRLGNKHANKSIDPKELWPEPKQQEGVFDRELFEIPFSDEYKEADLWVARYEALPETWKPGSEQVVWTAGVKTWKKLAARGVWVNGSSDGLGEQQEDAIEVLLDRPVKWLKLSHSEGYKSPGKDFLATYRLKVKDDLPDLSTKKYFFWRSASTFLAAIKIYPQIKAASHACGPGNSFEIMRDYEDELGELKVYLNFNQWFASLTGQESI